MLNMFFYPFRQYENKANSLRHQNSTANYHKGLKKQSALKLQQRRLFISVKLYEEEIKSMCNCIKLIYLGQCSSRPLPASTELAASEIGSSWRGLMMRRPLLSRCSAWKSVSQNFGEHPGLVNVINIALSVPKNMLRCSHFLVLWISHGV